MKLYSSLVFRELKLIRRGLIWKTVLILFFAAFMLIPFAAIRYSDSADADVLYFVVMVCGLVPFSTAALAGTSESVYRSDVNSGWNTFSFALPVTSRERTAAMFIIKIITAAAGAFLSVLYGFAGMMINAGGTEEMPVMKFMIMSYLFSLVLISVYTTVEQAVIMQATDEKSVKKYGIIAGFLGFAAYVTIPQILGRLFTKENTREDLIPDSIEQIISGIFDMCSVRNMVVCIAAFLIILAAGFALTVHFYERREP